MIHEVIEFGQQGSTKLNFFRIAAIYRCQIQQISISLWRNKGKARKVIQVISPLHPPGTMDFYTFSVKYPTSFYIHWPIIYLSFTAAGCNQVGGWWFYCSWSQIGMSPIALWSILEKVKLPSLLSLPGAFLFNSSTSRLSAHVRTWQRYKFAWKT